MSESPDPDRLHHDALQRELEAARERRDSYQALLKDLPQIFEGRFRERLRPLQQRNEQLLLEGAALREQGRRSLPQARAQDAAFSPSPEEPMAATASGKGDSGQAGGTEPANPSPPILDRRQSPRRPGAWVAADVQQAKNTAGAGSQRPGLGGRPWLLSTGIALTLAAAVLGLRGLSKPGVATSGSSLASSAGREGRPPVAAAEQGSLAVDGPGAVARRSGGEVQAGSLRLESREPSWLEVETSDGTSLYFGLLQGEQSFPVGKGLRIRAGRPDLIQIHWPGGSQQRLGSVDDLDWREIRAQSGGG
ncbi:MAG: hypothetical protein ACO3B3_07150 [Cyanobium sp.]